MASHPTLESRREPRIPVPSCNYRAPETWEDFLDVSALCGASISGNLTCGEGVQQAVRAWGFGALGDRALGAEPRRQAGIAGCWVFRAIDDLESVGQLYGGNGTECLVANIPKLQTMLE